MLCEYIYSLKHIFLFLTVKEEKVSLPPEPMDTDTLPLDIEVKQEADKDEIAMPPPSMPVPSKCNYYRVSNSVKAFIIVALNITENESINMKNNLFKLAC